MGRAVLSSNISGSEHQKSERQHTVNKNNLLNFTILIVDIQRRRVKDTYKKYQQNLRSGSKASQRTSSPNDQIKRRTVQGKKLPPLAQNKEPQAIVVSEDKPEESLPIAEVNIAEIPETTVDIAKTNNFAIITNKVENKLANFESNIVQTDVELNLSENSDKEQNSSNDFDLENDSSTSKLLLNIPGRSLIKKAFFTASLRPTLPPINESIDKEANVKRKVGRDHNDILGGLGVPKAHNPYYGSNKGGSSIGRGSDSPDQSGNETVMSAQKATSLRARIADLEKQHMQEFLRKQNLQTKPKPYESKTDLVVSDSHTTSSSPSCKDKDDHDKKVSRSIAVERKRLAKLRATHRKAVLNSENSYQFVQLSDGTFLPGATAYKRKRFLPPSNRAQYERDQILKSEAAKMEMNDKKIGAFFTKLNLPPPVEVSKKVLKRKDTKSTINLSEIRPVVVVEPVKRENSLLKPLTEIAKSVAYIREYIRPCDRPHYILQNTSWSQKY